MRAEPPITKVQNPKCFANNKSKANVRPNGAGNIQIPSVSKSLTYAQTKSVKYCPRPKSDSEATADAVAVNRFLDPQGATNPQYVKFSARNQAKPHYPTVMQ